MTARNEWRESFERLETRMDHEFGILRGEMRELRRDLVAFRGDMDARFDRLSAESNDRFDRFGARIDERFDQQNARIDARFERLEERLVSQTRWGIGMVGLMATLVTMLLAIEQLGLGAR